MSWNGKFVAVTGSTNFAAYSEDGINWISTTLPSSRDWRVVCHDNERFVAIASYSDVAAYSYDGFQLMIITGLFDMVMEYFILYHITLQVLFIVLIE